MYEYLVSQGMVKKLVRVREKKHLVQAIGEAFGVDVEDLMVRYYVAAFDDYVDLDNVAELPDQTSHVCAWAIVGAHAWAIIRAHAWAIIRAHARAIIRAHAWAIIRAHAWAII
ncbi:hypothetical protein FJT64_007445 [Amphibalanus amphitrite]|uniref:Uncharacterized protein n=1 Tax=Amphibalanus amphitrite TaxID=1232801 RepID=A0A6A4VLG8_AMPAM|nr:hypothetical protein FJT64_007445 [Amphibalanus amphitrite]